MSVSTPLDIQQYYKNLLIAQYNGLPKASGTIGAYSGMAIIPQTSVQTISYSLPPTSGTFKLSYNDEITSTLNWNDSAGTIQNALRALDGLSGITVSGSIASQLLTVTFTGVVPPALSLIVNTNTLLASATAVTISFLETDVTLPLAVQDGFNLISETGIAVGIQLDTIGKYCGVTRSGQGFTNFIILNDSDFFNLIQIAIFKNNSGSSMLDVQNFISRFYPGLMYVYDHLNMTITFIISQQVGSQDLVQLMVTEGLLPSPMTVKATLYFPPTAILFSYVTYESLATDGVGYNTYSNFHTNWTWLSYSNLIPT